MPSIFATFKPPFPVVNSVNDEIETSVIISSSESVLPFFDSLGFAFSFIKKDIGGNVAKMRKAYEEDPTECHTLRTMITRDLKLSQGKNVNSATMALLWLRRIVEDHNTGTKRENLVEFCKKAYEESLRPYHGFIVSKIFSTVSHAIPWRKDLLRSLSNGDVAVGEEQVIKDMAEFVGVLFPVVQNIHRLQVELNVDYPDKV